MTELREPREIPDEAWWNKVREGLATWDQLRAEVQAVRSRLWAELNAYRSRKPETTQ
jgi:hypothetical protein